MKKSFLLTGFILLVSLISFSSFQSEGLVDDVLNYTNKFRKSRGLDPLVIREDLNTIAREHSEDMAKGRQGFGHGGFDQRYHLVIKKIKGANAYAENVAYGSRSGKEVVEGWKGSAPHRRNMLGKYRYIGIGTAKDRRGVIYYTQVFVN